MRVMPSPQLFLLSFACASTCGLSNFDSYTFLAMERLARKLRPPKFTGSCNSRDEYI